MHRLFEDELFYVIIYLFLNKYINCCYVWTFFIFLDTGFVDLAQLRLVCFSDFA